MHLRRFEFFVGDPFVCACRPSNPCSKSKNIGAHIKRSRDVDKLYFFHAIYEVIYYHTSIYYTIYYLIIAFLT